MKKYLPTLIYITSLLSPTLAAKWALYYFAKPLRIPRPESEKKVFEEAKKYYLKSGYAAFEWGESTHPIVLLIHGWNGRGTQIAQFSYELTKNHFRVIAVDGPGHGDSPGSWTTPTHFAKFISDVQHELAPDNGVHCVIAHSFGGGCSVYSASKELKTKSLVLIASPAFYHKVVDYFATNFGLRSSKAKSIFTNLVTDLAGIHPNELAIGKIGKDLNLPALIVHDEQDSAVSFESALALHENWPGSKLLKTNGLGHRRILKDPQVLRDVADFIKKI